METSAEALNASGMQSIFSLTSLLGGQLDLIAAFGVFLTLGMFVVQQHRSNRIEKQENYLKLEMASIELFKFEFDNAALLTSYDELSKPAGAAPTPVEEKQVSAFYFMTLNLFEISIRMRHDKTIAPEIFGSWVVWYYDTLTSWYFRENWDDFRENYTPEIKAIFDPFVEEFDQTENDYVRKQRFFENTAKILRCKVIGAWLNTKKGVAS